MTGVAVKVTEVPAQTGLAEATMETLTGSRGFTVIITGVEEAGLPVAQVALEESTQEMASLFAGGKAYVAFVAPVRAVPFNFHWYCGAGPPLTMVVLKVTDVPAHTGLADGEITILTGKSGLTVMVTTFEPAGFPVAQVAFERISQAIVFALEKIWV